MVICLQSMRGCTVRSRVDGQGLDTKERLANVSIYSAMRQPWLCPQGCKKIRLLVTPSMSTYFNTTLPALWIESLSAKPKRGRYLHHLINGIMLGNPGCLYVCLLASHERDRERKRQTERERERERECVRLYPQDSIYDFFAI
jgi:hypothetical protein